MYISHKWLQSYLPDLNDFTPDQIAESLTDSLAEVEGYLRLGTGLDKIIAGEVISVEAHPSHKKLKVCQVNIGNEEKTILCGAPNVEAGLRVAVCLPGGAILNPNSELGHQQATTISEKVIGEVTSQGMICSEKELGISQDHTGIMVLEPEMELATNLIPELQDIIYEIENKSLGHRPDAFSHHGIARELAAILNTELIEPSYDLTLIPTAQLALKIDKKVKEELCPRFTAIVLQGVEIKLSPFWLRTRLAHIGIRAVNNVVDITNFVMMDMGQPLHSFDYNKIRLEKLVVRQAKNKEKLKALDGKTYTLNDQMLVVADDDGAQSIAGIMGGASTEISPKTKNIILEAANWNMYNIRRTSRHLGLRSEASTRFEKGQDANQTAGAIKACINLIQDLAGGELASDLLDLYEKPRNPKTVTLRVTQVKRFLGVDITRTQIIELLERLNFEYKEAENAKANEVQSESLKFEIPTYRADINIEQDLLEEIARLFGYQNIPATLPTAEIRPVKDNPTGELMRKVNYAFLSAGFDELLTYSFVGEKLYKKALLDIKQCLRLKNPLSPELEYMRNSLIPSLISKLKLNSRNFTRPAYFEIGRIIEKALDKEGIHLQPRMVAGLVYEPESKLIFYDIKGVVERILAELKLEGEFTEKKAQVDFYPANAFHPARSALITITDEEVGVVGEAHPELMINFELKGRVGFFELNFDKLLKLHKDGIDYKRLSDYQEVRRDLSFWITKDTTYAQVRHQVLGTQNELIKKVEFKDSFTPKKKREQRSITITLTLQSGSKTLTELEIKDTVVQVVERIEGKLKATLRG